MNASGGNTLTLRLLVVALLAGLWAAAASAHGGLTRLSGPKGGEIVYGPVTGVSAAPAAMGTVLRMLHQRFGARPEVGRVVDLQGTGSSTLRFLVNPPQGPAVGGMIVLAQGEQGFEAGVVLDDSQRLATSFNPMLQALAEAWHPGPSGAAGARAPMAPPAPLRPFVLSDNSARVGLPDGWQVTRESSGGTILAHGPRGEFAALGAPYLAYDTSTAQGLAVQRSAAGLRNTSYATAIYYPFSQDLGRTFVDLARITGERNHAPANPMRVERVEPLADRNGMRCAHLQGEGGLEPGRGQGRFDTIFCVGAPIQGMRMSLAYHVAAPAALADAELATLLAVRASFEPNDRVIQQQAGRFAAPGIAHIREIGRQATLRAAEADRTRIDMRNRFEANNNTRERLAQGFSNYLRDQTVIVDRDNNTHGTTWNSVADSMVKNNPQRYGYVDGPGYWKGVDY